MTPTPDVLIVGGGVVGLSCAYALAEVGLKVEVIDRQALGREASWAGAGIIPPGNFERATTPLDRLRAFSVSQFPAFMQMLESSTGLPTGYRICGGIEFLDPENEYAVDLWRQEGIAFESLTVDELRTLEPAILPPASGYVLPGMAQVRNPWFLRSLIAACEQIGVTLRPDCSAEGWILRRGEVDGVSLNIGGELHAGNYVLAAGAWAEPWLNALGCSLGVWPVRGQMLLYRTETPLLNHVVIVGKHYLVPRADGRLLVGATEENDAGFTKENTISGTWELQSFAEEIVPALAKLNIETNWAGLRPGSPDGHPSIGAVANHVNVFAAVGHFRAGIQLSLGTARMIRDLVTKSSPIVDPAAFALDRIPNFHARPAFRS